jgi:hypothetical protein
MSGTEREREKEERERERERERRERERERREREREIGEKRERETVRVSDVRQSVKLVSRRQFEPSRNFGVKSANFWCLLRPLRQKDLLLENRFTRPEK